MPSLNAWNGRRQDRRRLPGGPDNTVKIAGLFISVDYAGSNNIKTHLPAAPLPSLPRTVAYAVIVQVLPFLSSAAPVPILVVGGHGGEP